MTNTAIITFGRFNPITKGHEKLIEMLDNSEHDSFIFPSRSEGSAKNPMPFDIKVSILEAIADIETQVIDEDEIKNILDALKYINEDYSDVVIVVGSDRLDEFKELTNKYNNDLYEFNSIEFESSGDRSDDNISASRMKEVVYEGDIKTFKDELCPDYLKEDYVKYYNLVESCIEGATDSYLIFEEISNQARIKKAAVARRNKSKLKLGRSIAMKRKAGTKKLKSRARKSAISDVKKLVTKGKKASELSFGEKKRAEKLVKRKKGLVDRLAKKGLKDARARQNSR